MKFANGVEFDPLDNEGVCCGFFVNDSDNEIWKRIAKDETITNKEKRQILERFKPYSRGKK